MSAEQTFTLHRGTRPLLVSLPHVGTLIPDDIRPHLLPRALGLGDRGTLAAGQRADFAVWDLEHPNELAYWFGHNPCRRVVVAGEER